MEFARPEAFWFLLLLPMLLLFLWWRERQRTAYLRRFGDPALLCHTPSRWPFLQARWPQTALWLLPFLCIILALADPHVPSGPLHLRAQSLDVVILLDVSKSMAAEDYGPRSRLEQARASIRQLLSHLRSNRVGLVTFAGVAFPQAELTDDVVALDFILQHWVDEDAVGVGGSDLAGAIEMALALFPEGSEREKLMLLFSDGGDDTLQVQASLHKALRRDIRIVTMGVGQPQPARIPLYDKHRHFVGHLQQDGQIVTTQLNEAPLQHIAATTGGSYVRLMRGDEWRRVFARRDLVGKALRRDTMKLFQLFLFGGLIAFWSQRLVRRL